MHDEYKKFLEEKGINLFETKVGVREWALSRADALEALKILRGINVPNLGGDVVVEKEGEYRYTNDNWFSNQKGDELLNDYVNRSITESEEYIKKYPEKDDGRYCYVLVPRGINTEERGARQ